MSSFFGRTVRWCSICILLQICFFNKNISGEAENVEATINLRLDSTTQFSFEYNVNTNKYQLFQEYFFNQTITLITLHYTYDRQSRYIDDIFPDSNIHYNGTFFICQNFPRNSSIQCEKKSGGFDSLSDKCLNGTGIQWFYEDEYLSSEHFRNYIIKEEKNIRVICYTLLYSVNDTTKLLPTGSSIAPATITTDGSSASPAGVIAGVSIGIVIVIFAIVIIVVILRKRKRDKDDKESSISNIQTTNRTNAYNEQALKQNKENINTNTHFNTTKFEGDLNLNNSKDRSILINSYTEIDPDYAGIDEAENIETDIQISTTEANEDDYTYIDDNDATRNGKGISIDDDYSTLDQTIEGMGESVEQRKNSSRGQVPNYNNVGIKIENGLKETGKKNDDYSKLREKNLDFQNIYGELDQESINEEENCPELNTDNVNANEEPGRKRNVYSKLGDKMRDFQNAYGEIDEESLDEEEDCPAVEVNNTYFVLENENTYPDTLNIEK